jgi:hypothetical protein
MTHRDSVANPRDREDKGVTPIGVNAFFHETFQISHPNVTWDQVREATHNADEGATQLRSRQTCSVKKCAMWCPFHSLLDPIASHETLLEVFTRIIHEARLPQMQVVVL